MSGKGNIPETYPLDTAAPALKKFRPPGGPFDPAGPWRQRYGVYTLAGRSVTARRVGQVMLRRRVGQKGNVALEMQYRKNLTPGAVHAVDAVMHTRADSRLSTPRTWSFTSWTQRGAKSVAGTQLKKTATADGKAITIKDSRHTRTIRLAGQYTLNWCLFDAVQRLAREKTEPIRFTLIDHFDQVKGGQTLSFRKVVDAPVAGGRKVRVHGYDLVGRGNVPFTFWVDAGGRLLFVVAGLEGYFLEPPKSS